MKRILLTSIGSLLLFSFAIFAESASDFRCRHEITGFVHGPERASNSNDLPEFEILSPASRLPSDFHWHIRLSEWDGSLLKEEHTISIGPTMIGSINSAVLNDTLRFDIDVALTLQRQGIYKMTFQGLLQRFPHIQRVPARMPFDFSLSSNIFGRLFHTKTGLRAKSLNPHFFKVLQEKTARKIRRAIIDSFFQTPAYKVRDSLGFSKIKSIYLKLANGYAPFISDASLSFDSHHDSRIDPDEIRIFIQPHPSGTLEILPSFFVSFLNKNKVVEILPSGHIQAVPISLVDLGDYDQIEAPYLEWNDETKIYGVSGRQELKSPFFSEQ